MSLETGQVIASRYTVERLIGRGGMGEVYQGTDSDTHVSVAIKALKPEIIEDDPDLLLRFNREGEALRRLDHPNIVKMLAAVEEQDRHYIVMEYVPGGSLNHILKK